MNPTPPSTTIANTTTLSAIETKVRRLTRSPSPAQLSQAELDDYINTSVVYDFPEMLRTFNLKTTFNFVCNPGQDVYNTDEASFAGATNNTLYNFQNKYLTCEPPVFIAGYQSMWSQQPEQFYSIYPQINSIANIGQTGNGATMLFTGVINSQQAINPPNVTQVTSLVQGQVMFTSIDANGEGLAMADVPLVDPTTGYKTTFGNLYSVTDPAYASAQQTPPQYPADLDVNNTINYTTGAFTVTFPAAPGNSQAIYSQCIPQVRAIPQSIMFYSNQFTLRPIPDMPYRISFQVYQRPTALLSAGQSPELEEYWQFIAYLAAKKVLEDRMDMETVALILPELQNQERLCLRRTLVQLTNQRTGTIYAEQTGAQSAYNGFGIGGGQF